MRSARDTQCEVSGLGGCCREKRGQDTALDIQLKINVMHKLLSIVQ